MQSSVASAVSLATEESKASVVLNHISKLYREKKLANKHGNAWCDCCIIEAYALQEADIEKLKGGQKLWMRTPGGLVLVVHGIMRMQLDDSEPRKVIHALRLVLYALARVSRALSKTKGDKPAADQIQKQVQKRGRCTIGTDILVAHGSYQAFNMCIGKQVEEWDLEHVQRMKRFLRHVMNKLKQA